MIASEHFTLHRAAFPKLINLKPKDMLQQEFEERTGLKLSVDGYAEVEECYVNTDLDKDAFCKLWIENPTVLKEIERKTVFVNASLIS